jgi:hypothetical protein
MPRRDSRVISDDAEIGHVEVQRRKQLLGACINISSRVAESIHSRTRLERLPGSSEMLARGVQG